MRLLALAALTLVVTACMGGDDDDDPVTRDVLVAAFDAGGEPILLELDLAKAGPGAPGSHIDALYGPAEERSRFVLFSVVLLEEADAAPAHVDNVRRLTGDAYLVTHEKNVVLAVTSHVSAARRERLVTILESL